MPEPEPDPPPAAMTPNPEPGDAPPILKYIGEKIPSELLKPGPIFYVPDVEARVAALENRMTALEERVAAPPVGMGRRP